MPRGVPLTAEQLATLAELYAESLNASAVAAELKVSVSTVTRNLARLGEPKRAKLQRELLGGALLEASEGIADSFREAREFYRHHLQINALEPGHVGTLLQGLSRAGVALASLDAREEKRRQARLTRQKTRAETARIERDGRPLPEQLLEQLAGLSRDDLTRLLEAVRARRVAAAAATPPAPKPEG